MAWEEDAVEIVRVLVDDVEAAVYSDEKLLRVLTVAAFHVSRAAAFEQTFTVSFSNSTVSPDPTLSATRDDSFLNLATLKAASIIDHGGAVAAARRAISVRDGGSSVDLRGVFGAKLDLLEKGWTAVYENELHEYKSGLAHVAGAAVIGPFRLVAHSGGSLGYFGGGDRDREY